MNKSRSLSIAVVAGVSAASLFAISAHAQQADVITTAAGTTVVKSASKKLGFHGKTPTAQRAHADQATITDSTGGSDAATAAAGTGVSTITFPIDLASVASGDVLTNYTPGYKFKILSVSFAVNKPATTAAKAATLNMEIGTTNLTGGAVALTSANCTPQGNLVAGSSITAANTGTASDTFSIEASSVTAFVEGTGELLVKIQNMDTADAHAAELARINEILTALTLKGAIKGGP